MTLTQVINDKSLVIRFPKSIKLGLCDGSPLKTINFGLNRELFELRQYGQIFAQIHSFKWAVYDISDIYVPNCWVDLSYNSRVIIDFSCLWFGLQSRKKTWVFMNI